MTRSFRSEIDLVELEDNAELSEVITHYNKLVESYNFFTKTISIQSNFDGFLAENVVIPSLTEVKIQHFLGIKPKWRILLRQIGNGVVTDIPSSWDDKVITLYNSGAVEVTVTVFIARE